MVLVPQPYGEIVDRLVILALKVDRLTEPAAREAARALHDAIAAQWDAAGQPAPATLPEHAALVAVNAELWDVEGAIRRVDPDLDAAAYLALARRVPTLNDRRGALKAAIDRRLGAVGEPKEY